MANPLLSRSNLSSQAHLDAGGLGLERLRQHFLQFLNDKEREVLARQAAGESGSQVGGGEGSQPGASGGGGEAMSEWL